MKLRLLLTVLLIKFSIMNSLISADLQWTKIGRWNFITEHAAFLMKQLWKELSRNFGTTYTTKNKRPGVRISVPYQQTEPTYGRLQRESVALSIFPIHFLIPNSQDYAYANGEKSHAIVSSLVLQVQGNPIVDCDS